VDEGRLEVQRAGAARGPEEHRLGRAVELDDARAPDAGEAALEGGRQGRPPEEERVDGEVACGVEAVRPRDLPEHHRLEGQPGEHLGAGAPRQREGAREGHVPVDVAGGDGDPPSLQGHELHQVRRRGHEREAVQDDPAGGEDVGVHGAKRPRVACEVLAREPGGVGGAARARRLPVVADVRQRERARAVDAGRLQVGPRRQGHALEVGGSPDTDAGEAVAVQGAPTRTRDRRIEGRDQVVSSHERIHPRAHPASEAAPKSSSRDAATRRRGLFPASLPAC
jgi:hypothetical protein